MSKFNEFTSEKLNNAFEKIFKKLNQTQIQSLKYFKEKKHMLITSPTGSGKTLAAFLGIIDELLTIPTDNLTTVYLCPLKALINDLVKNLNNFLDNLEDHNIIIKSRTGDTNSKHRKIDILTANVFCTTPESLSLILISEENIERLKKIKYIIIDEAHALIENKRGTEVSILIARLKLLNPDLKIIGMSATVDPIDDVSYVLFGNQEFGLVHANERKKPNLTCIVPKQKSYEDLEYSQHLMSIMITNIIKKEKCTLIFVNTRSGAERMTHRLSLMSPQLNIKSHHSSMSKENRIAVEEGLKNNKINVVVSSCSLEQGIDIPTITKVIQCFSPRQINKATQRIGRAGHGFYSTTDAIFFALTRCEAVEIGIILRNITLGKLDKINIPNNCLDMLYQAILNICFTNALTRNEIINFVKTITTYENISSESINKVIDSLLSLEKPDKNRRYFARIYENAEGKLKSYKGIKKIEYMLNIGSIVSDDMLTVKNINNNSIIGYLDDSFLLEINKGDSFILGGEKYEYKYTKSNTVFAIPTIAQLDLTPAWVSETLPISFEVGCDVTNFRAKVLDKFFNFDLEDIDELFDNYHLNPIAKYEIFDHFKKQYIWLKQNNSKNNLKQNTLIEIIEDNQNTNIIFHICFGQKTNTLIALIIKNFILEKLDININSKTSNNGILFIVNTIDVENLIIILPEIYETIHELESYKLIEKLKLYVVKTEFFNNALKKNAYRTLNLLSNPVKKNTVPSYIILNSLKQENNIAFMETIRELIYDVLNVNILKKIIQGKLIGNFEIIKSNFNSPFSHGILFNSTNVDTNLSSKFITNINENIIQRIKNNQYIFSSEEDQDIIFYQNSIIIFDKLQDIKTLVIGDTHIGMEYTNKLNTVDSLKQQLESVSFILNTIENIKKIVVLGDIKDSFESKNTSFQELNDVRFFIDFLKQNFQQVILLKGNHDGILERYFKLPFKKEVKNPKESIIMTRKLYINNILLMHGDQKKEEFEDHSKYIIIGHEHPRVNFVKNNIFQKKLTGILQLDKLLIVPSHNIFKAGRDVEFIIQDKKELIKTTPFAYVFAEDSWNKIKIN